MGGYIEALVGSAGGDWVAAVGCDECVVRQKGRYASGRGYGQVRLSVVLSKRQWRVRESWVNAWAESSVRTHTPGPTSGLAIKKDRGPMAEGTQTPLKRPVAAGL